jgi:hypothetical protein
MRNQQGRLKFEYELSTEESSVTSFGGLPIILDVLRALGASESVRRNVTVAERPRKHDEAWVVEALVMLLAAGGDCLDDIDVLRGDKALERLVEREFPSAETLRKFLYEFHDEERMAAAKKAAEERQEKSFVPEENERLRGLGRVIQDFVASVAARGHGKRATLDIDATIQESHKKEAKPHYEGGRGYQPIAAYWAEQDLLLADEFRDGNVPAGKGTQAFVERAFAALPKSVEERRLRADSALYDALTIRWLLKEKIAFSISADMTRELQTICRELDESKWMALETRADETVAWAEVSFFPGNWSTKIERPRYLVLRFTPAQGSLFAERGPKYLAIVTNREGDAAELIRWHWEKAGTIEHVHDVIKNELGAGVLPCGRFGANAAWFRIALLTYNVLSALKSISLPPDLHDARPKRLRFQIFTIPATVITHARRTLARIAAATRRAKQLVTARAPLWEPLPVPM